MGVGGSRLTLAGRYRVVQLFESETGAEVAEGFAAGALGAIGDEEGGKSGDDVFEGDHIAVDESKPGALGVTADEDSVFPGGFTDESDIGSIGASAAVGAAGHVDSDAAGLESESGDFDIELIDDAWEHAFGFGDGQSAGGEGGAGDGVAAKEGQFFDREDAIFVEHPVDFGLVLGVDVAEDEALEWSEADFHVEASEDGAESGFDSECTDILDASIFDIDTEEETAVALGVPPEVVVDVGNVGGVGIGERSTKVFFDLGLERGDSPVGDEIFQTGALAVFAVAEVTLHFDDGFADGDDVFGSCEGDTASQCGECFFV